MPCFASHHIIQRYVRIFQVHLLYILVNSDCSIGGVLFHLDGFLLILCSWGTRVIIDDILMCCTCSREQNAHHNQCHASYIDANIVACITIHTINWFCHEMCTVSSYAYSDKKYKFCMVGSLLTTICIRGNVHCLLRSQHRAWFYFLSLHKKKDTSRSNNRAHRSKIYIYNITSI